MESTKNKSTFYKSQSFGRYLAYQSRNKILMTRHQNHPSTQPPSLSCEGGSVAAVVAAVVGAVVAAVVAADALVVLSDD